MLPVLLCESCSATLAQLNAHRSFCSACRTKALVLELLAAVCLVRGGHEIILSAFDNFKEVDPGIFTSACVLQKLWMLYYVKKVVFVSVRAHIQPIIWPFSPFPHAFVGKHHILSQSFHQTRL